MPNSKGVEGPKEACFRELTRQMSNGKGEQGGKGRNSGAKGVYHRVLYDTGVQRGGIPQGAYEAKLECLRERTRPKGADYRELMTWVLSTGRVVPGRKGSLQGDREGV